MRLGGREIVGGHEVILVLPRGSEDELVFRAKAVLTLDDFYTICPEPKPPGKLTKNGWEPNTKDENYQKSVAHHFEQRVAYLVIHSLAPSNIEWDTIDINNPATWTNYIEDFKSAGFSTIEINRIIGIVLEANSLDEAKLERAREVFLLGQRLEREKSSSQATEQSTTPSGEPVQG